MILDLARARKGPVGNAWIKCTHSLVSSHNSCEIRANGIAGVKGLVLECTRRSCLGRWYLDTSAQQVLIFLNFLNEVHVHLCTRCFHLIWKGSPRRESFPPRIPLQTAKTLTCFLSANSRIIQIIATESQFKVTNYGDSIGTLAYKKREILLHCRWFVHIFECFQFN